MDCLSSREVGDLHSAGEARRNKDCLRAGLPNGREKALLADLT